MQTQSIEFNIKGIDTAGFLARPDSVTPVPGIIVLQEWWGLNAHIKDVATRLAAEGFVTLAPDLYHGRTVSEPDDARKAAMELDRARAIQEINAAVSFLKSQDYVMPKKIGITGFCMGGGITLWVAAKNPDIGAAVAFYGGGSPEAKEFQDTKAAILNITGERDERVTTTIRELDRNLNQYSLVHEMIVYPNAEHAFFNDTRTEVYNADAAKDAWTKALNWFRKYLQV